MTSNEDEKKEFVLSDDEKRQLKSVCEALNADNIDVLELAREITLMDHAVFAQVDDDEYQLYVRLNSEAWPMKMFDVLEQCPGILAVGRRYNACFMWVQYEVLRRCGDKLSLRRILEKFIDVAWECRHLNNFQAVSFIIKAITCHPVRAMLEGVKEQLSPSHQRRSDFLKNLVSSLGRLLDYKRELSASTPPAVPDHGLFLKELLNLPSSANGHTWRTKTEEIRWICLLKEAQLLEDITLQVGVSMGHIIGSDIAALIATYCAHTRPYNDVLCEERLNSHRSSLASLAHEAKDGDVDTRECLERFASTAADNSQFRKFDFGHNRQLNGKLLSVQRTFEKHRWWTLELYMGTVASRRNVSA